MHSRPRSLPQPRSCACQELPLPKPAGCAACVRAAPVGFTAREINYKGFSSLSDPQR